MQNFIIDFDGTFTRVEALEELAKLSLDNNPDKEQILADVEMLTEFGMEGKISFSESLSKRLNLIHANKRHIEKLIKVLKKKVTKSFARNKSFFRRYARNVYIFSGGFKEFIVPIVSEFGILEHNVYANTFTYNKEGNIIGYDKKNLMAQEEGKVMQLLDLNLKGDIYVIGDGYTDYQMKETGLIKKFFAFTENIERKIVIEKADSIAPSFDEFLYQNNLPTAISYPKNRIKVLLLENIHQNAVDIFKDEGYPIEHINGALDEEELIKKIKDASIIGIRSKTQITQRVLDSATRLLAIGAFCIGTNQIDLEYAAKKGVAVFNAPYSNTRSVVELVIGELIMLVRLIFVKSNKLHNGIWDKSADGTFEIRGKKLGIIGYGNIGSQLSVLAESMGLEVYYYDITDKLSLGNAHKCKSLKELLTVSDIISVHVDGRPENRNIIGEQEFKAMKDGVLFLNLSRGFVVEMKALAKYLRNEKIKGAAIDVFPLEPKDNTEEFRSELRGISNVILTPHIGGSTQEAHKNIAEFVPGKIIEYVNTGNTVLSPNYPNLTLPELHDAHRLIHTHNNVPGILAKINNAIAKAGINILGQYLKTNEQIGYAITDVGRKYDKKVIGDIKKIQDTIKFRLLK